MANDFIHVQRIELKGGTSLPWSSDFPAFPLDLPARSSFAAILSVSLPVLNGNSDLKKIKAWTLMI